MAESSVRAFGRYLRTLRERRGLSLEEVCSLSQTFPEKITKSYLSRCENGRQKVALAKLIPISRIYDAPAEVLIERMELDLELDRIGGPDTAGKSYAELADAAREASDRGYRWDAYACARDALAIAGASPVQPQYSGADEQLAIATLNVGTDAKVLGRRHFALHEFLYVERSGALSPLNHARSLERIASAFQELGRLPTAASYADRAIALAEASGDDIGLAYNLQTRGLIALADHHPESAVVLYRRSYALHARGQRIASCASVLVSLAQCYLAMEKPRAARQSCSGALRLLHKASSSRTRAAALAVLGIIEEAEDRPALAKELWGRAAELAKEVKDRVLRFQVEFFLFRRAVRDDNTPVARAIHRRLTRLCPWVPSDVEELSLFRALEESEYCSQRNSVSARQPDSSMPCN